MGVSKSDLSTTQIQSAIKYGKESIEKWKNSQNTVKAIAFIR